MGHHSTVDRMPGGLGRGYIVLLSDLPCYEQADRTAEACDVHNVQQNRMHGETWRHDVRDYEPDSHRRLADQMPQSIGLKMKVMN